MDLKRLFDHHEVTFELVAATTDGDRPHSGRKRRRRQHGVSLSVERRPDDSSRRAPRRGDTPRTSRGRVSDSTTCRTDVVTSRSSRNRPNATSSNNVSWDVAMRRTSTWLGAWVEPRRGNSRLARKGDSASCSGGLSSLAPLRRSVPPLACSTRDGRRIAALRPIRWSTDRWTRTRGKSHISSEMSAREVDPAGAFRQSS